MAETVLWLATCAVATAACAAPLAGASVASASSGNGVEARSASCGARWEGSEEPCPLQLWMREHVSASFADDNYPVLADALTTASKWSPDPEWEWEAIATAGADAARRGDVDGIKQACRACHTRYRPTYKERYRPRPRPRPTEADGD